MKLYYGHALTGNFGDDLNPWLMPKILPGVLDDDADDLLVGIGTLLNHKVPLAPRISVFGSGYGYGRAPEVSGNWHFYAVRGPLTAQRLGLAANVALGDPGCLVTEILLEGEVIDPVSEAAFMPHFESAQSGIWQRVAQEAGLRMIDPRWPVERVLKEMRRSPMVVTEAMHGAIVCDALRIPWVAVKPNAPKHRAKWQDWAQSVDVQINFANVGVSSLAEMRATIRDHVSLRIKGALFQTPFWRYFVDTSPQTDDLSFHGGDRAKKRRREPASFDPVQSFPGFCDQSLIRKAVRDLRAVARMQPQLSADTALGARRAGLIEAAGRLIADYRQRHAA